MKIKWKKDKLKHTLSMERWIAKYRNYRFIWVGSYDYLKKADKQKDKGTLISSIKVGGQTFNSVFKEEGSKHRYTKEEATKIVEGFLKEVYGAYEAPVPKGVRRRVKDGNENER